MEFSCTWNGYSCTQVKRRGKYVYIMAEPLVGPSYLDTQGWLGLGRPFSGGPSCFSCISDKQGLCLPYLAEGQLMIMGT